MRKWCKLNFQNKSIRPVLGLLFFSFLVYGCSAPEKTKPQVHMVEIYQMKFQPDELRIKSGDTVVFINKDIVLHDVTELPDKTWTSQPMNTGKSWSRVFTKSSDYYCSIHQVMKGKIVVE